MFMARKRSRKREKKVVEEKVSKPRIDKKLIIGALIILAIVGGKYLSSQSGKAEVKPVDTLIPQSSDVGLYETLNRPSTHEPGKVKIIEFMSFYCHQCYNFNSLKPELEEKYRGKLEIELLPIYWGEGSIKPGEAYLIAKDLGFGAEMKDAIFNANTVEKRDIGNEDVLISLARGIGLGDEFMAKLRSGAAEARANENLQLAGTYRVEETPTLIIDGNLKVTPHETGDSVAKMTENLDEIIKEILKE
ncbi:MAG TPA: hypothetical protein ENH13_02420 [Euryarchaeota archaeon]|nr:hypothetical protein [Euryarchaeota archaeon]